MFLINKHISVTGNKTAIFIPVLLVFMLFGCSPENLTSPERSQTEDMSPKSVITVNKASQNISPVRTFSDMEKVGHSKLVRNGNGVSFRLQTSELEPGTVVTLWMVIFNEPGNCIEGCGADALTNSDAQADLQYASGRVIGDSGKTTYAGHLNEGDNSESILPIWLGLPAPGLVDAQEAEIHFVVHSHGPKIADLVNEMLHSFNAGCGPIFDPAFPAVPEELGTYGPNTCRDVQFAVHMP